MANIGYIRTTGDTNYNFGMNDFTVEFFAETSSNSSPQTLFEITNNESAAANLYVKTRFITVLESGNINAYGIQTNWPTVLSGNANSFSISPTISSSNLKIFYNGNLLANTQYSYSSGNVVIANSAIVSGNVLVEAGQLLFSVYGKSFTANTQHFVSAERQNDYFYLFLDGTVQAMPVLANVNIPAANIVNSANTSQILSRVNGPALLTIGANKDGQNPFIGEFGDFRVTNGVARHITVSQPTASISSEFTDTELGTRAQDIIISGSNFVDDVHSHAPEERVQGQIFDALNLKVYQSLSANANLHPGNSVVELGFGLFKDSMSIGPYSSYTFTVGNVTGVYPVPWNSAISADGSVTINGTEIGADQWTILNGKIYLNGTAEGDVVIVNLSGDSTYYCIGSNAVTYLSANLQSTDASISVVNTAGLPTPVPSSNQRGIVFVGGERITYLYIDRTGNVLSGLTRGTLGTGTPNVWPIGTQVINASKSQLLPGEPGEYTWYNANSNLATTNSVISNFLVTQGSVSPFQAG